MIDTVKGVEPELGYGPILAVSQAEAAMRAARMEKTKTVCTYCGVGCSFDVWHYDRQILKIEPAEGPANGISTCVKGKFGWDFVNSGDRLTSPLIREGDKFRECSWDEALDLIATSMQAIKAQHGPDALEFIASSKCTNEESYLMQKLARAVIGTNNIDNCSRYCQSPATKGLSRTVGYGGDSGSIADIERADLVVIVGANPAENHPVLATRVKRAHKLRGQRLIVSDLRKNEMAARADILLRPNPSTDLVWLSAVAKTHPRQRLARAGLHRALGQQLRRIRRKPPALHPGICRAAHRHPRRDHQNRCRRNRARRQGLHPLGHGRHPALPRLRHLHRHLQPAAAHRQLQPPGHRRLSSARTQQRPGLQRLRLHARQAPRLHGGLRPRDPPEVGTRLGRRPSPTAKASTTT